MLPRSVSSPIACFGGALELAVTRLIDRVQRACHHLSTPHTTRKPTRALRGHAPEIPARLTASRFRKAIRVDAALHDERYCKYVLATKCRGTPVSDIPYAEAMSSAPGWSVWSPRGVRGLEHVTWMTECSVLRGVALTAGPELSSTTLSLRVFSNKQKP